MNKVILILSGDPAGKKIFDGVAKKSSWLWNINARNHLGKVAKDKLFWRNERDDVYNRFIAELFESANKAFNFEENYIKDLLNNKFLADDSDIKTDENGKMFHNFLFVIHGLSKELVEKLKDEYGAFQLHLTKQEDKSLEDRYDFVLYEDHENFEQAIESLLWTLTSSGVKEAKNEEIR